jgi:hypothetical protein
LVRGRVLATDTLPRLRAAVGGDRFRIRVTAEHAAHARTVLRLPEESHETADDDTVLFETLLAPGTDAARTLDTLVRAGVHVSEFAPVPLSLADLLESAARVAAGSAGDSHA